MVCGAEDKQPVIALKPIDLILTCIRLSTCTPLYYETTHQEEATIPVINETVKVFQYDDALQTGQRLKCPLWYRCSPETFASRSQILLALHIAPPQNLERGRGVSEATGGE